MKVALRSVRNAVHKFKIRLEEEADEWGERTISARPYCVMNLRDQGRVSCLPSAIEREHETEDDDDDDICLELA